MIEIARGGGSSGGCTGGAGNGRGGVGGNGRSVIAVTAADTDAPIYFIASDEASFPMVLRSFCSIVSTVHWTIDSPTGWSAIRI